MLLTVLTLQVAANDVANTAAIHAPKLLLTLTIFTGAIQAAMTTPASNVVVIVPAANAAIFSAGVKSLNAAAAITNANLLNVRSKNALKLQQPLLVLPALLL